jgi:hypothetical protein
MSNTNKGGSMENITIETAKVNTRCYSFEIKMVVLVLANNEEEAVSLLDHQGGYTCTRKVALIDDKPIYSEK